MIVPDDMPVATGEECVEELEDDAELESGTWNAGTERVVRNNSGVWWGRTTFGVVVRRLEVPKIRN